MKLDKNQNKVIEIHEVISEHGDIEDMTLIKIRLPIKPLSVNKLWRGRRFKTEDYKNFKDAVCFLLPPVQLVEGYVNIHYKFYLKNWKITDGDNLVKGLQDILVYAGFIEDDRKIIKYIIEKIPAKEDFIEIEIEKRETQNEMV